MLDGNRDGLIEMEGRKVGDGEEIAFERVCDIMIPEFDLNLCFMGGTGVLV